MQSKVISDENLGKTYADDPDYAVWLPPESEFNTCMKFRNFKLFLGIWYLFLICICAGQSGDGKTKLNEKYGY